VGTEVGAGVLLRPAVDNLRERGGLSTARWEVLLEHEHQYDVAFGIQAGGERMGRCRERGDSARHEVR
jgi:hypothetical protein